MSLGWKKVFRVCQKKRQSVGNTKTDYPALLWCFTWNNYPENHLDIIKCSKDIKDLIYQEELGEKGTPHLQGFCRLSGKKRLTTMKNLFSKKIHWEKKSPRSSLKQAIWYCCDPEKRIPEGMLVTKGKFKQIRPLKIIENLYPWQSTLQTKLDVVPDDRKVYIVYEHFGNTGKTAFCKFLCEHYSCIMVSGNATDMKHAICSFMEKEGDAPHIVIMNLPKKRSINTISWAGVESIKDGIFYSNKYEGGMCIYNPPHVIIFSNQRPALSGLSLDRWAIYTIENKKLIDMSPVNLTPPPEDSEG